MKKKCAWCKEEKDNSCFYAQTRSADGLQTRCKKCALELDNQRRLERLTQEQIDKKIRALEEEIFKLKQIIPIVKHKRVKKTREESKEWAREYIKNKIKTDFNYRLRSIIASRMYFGFRQIKHKKQPWKNVEDFLGADINTVKIYIEKQFKPGMSWENHTKDGWHIDHIIPMASAKNIEELLPLLHYTNLQPLWAIQNITKGDKVLYPQFKIAL